MGNDAIPLSGFRTHHDFRGSYRRSLARSARYPVQHSGSPLCHPRSQPLVDPNVISFVGGGWELLIMRSGLNFGAGCHPIGCSCASDRCGRRTSNSSDHPSPRLRPVSALRRPTRRGGALGPRHQIYPRVTLDKINPTHRKRAPPSLPPRSDRRTFSNTPHAPHARA